MGPRLVELPIVGPVLRFLPPVTTDNLVQVKEESFLVVLHSRSLPSFHCREISQCPGKDFY